LKCFDKIVFYSFIFLFVIVVHFSGSICLGWIINQIRCQEKGYPICRDVSRSL